MNTRSCQILAAITGSAALLLAGFAEAQQPNVTVICTSANLTRVHVDIISAGRSLAAIDRVAGTHDLYPIDNVTQHMADQLVNDHLQSDVYQCTTIYRSSERRG